MVRALITGITGQDGSYLAELLLDKGYEVHGLIRRSSSFNTARIDHIFDDLHLHYGDLSASITNVLHKVRPDEIYNLAAQSHVNASFQLPEYTADVSGLGVIRILEAIRELGIKPRFYQASSSELFGNSPSVPQDEQTPFYPRSPYACAKALAYYATVNYRESYSLFCCNGILFNHESPRRGETFVTRKITRAATRIKAGLQEKLLLGNMSAVRDWGHAKDYVRAMWLMLQQDKPDDYVIATGESHSVKQFVEEVFSYLELDWRKYVDVHPRYYRPTEVNYLLGNSAKARKALGWSPTISFKELVKLMVDADMKLAENEALIDEMESKAAAV